ncbi:DUF302 domain-containing protein [Sulfurimonas sp.]|uniref:DUF302 domain-containing protein n=1 Tax=Sulfurimonas sp. TaxID=2022749 RepID=UPI00286DDA7D|nr:DUF302 domain-containing protein [Sulfurimonas sp.]
MKKLLLGVLLLLASSSFANEVYKKEVATPHDVYMKEFKKAVKKNHMNVLYELDLIKKFKDAGYAKKFGADFNKNKLTAATTILLCNGYIGNQISNIDPEMMSLCPIKVSIISDGKSTKIIYTKYTGASTDREIAALLNTLDEVVINTIDLTTDEYMKKAFSSDSIESRHTDH